MVRRDGLTVVEVLVSIVILGVVIAVLSTTTVSSVRVDANSGARTQAVQVLSYLGRLASASDPLLLDGPMAWDYGELKGAFKELSAEANRANSDLYRASVSQPGQAGLGSTAVNVYHVEVCWMIGAEENCVNGDTAGPILPPPGEVGFPPVVN